MKSLDLPYLLQLASYKRLLKVSPTGLQRDVKLAENNAIEIRYEQRLVTS